MYALSQSLSHEVCPVRDCSAPVVPRQEEISGAATELIMFNFGDNVDRDTVDKVERTGDKSATKDAGFFCDCRLCRHCVPGFPRSNMRITTVNQVNINLTINLFLVFDLRESWGGEVDSLAG